MRFHCPTCKSNVERDAENFPFCCERCRLIDLGNWADGSYAIPAEEAPSIDEESQERLH